QRRPHPRERVVSRFFLIAFVPLVVVAALAWLALKPLHSGPPAQKKTYSQAGNYAERNQMLSVVFRPTKPEIDAAGADGVKIVVDYPTDQSAKQFQNVLRQHKIRFDTAS